jgi:hypothetical protein
LDFIDIVKNVKEVFGSTNVITLAPKPTSPDPDTRMDQFFKFCNKKELNAAVSFSREETYEVSVSKKTKNKKINAHGSGYNLGQALDDAWSSMKRQKII